MTKISYKNLAIGFLTFGGLLIGGSAVHADSTSEQETALQSFASSHASGYLYAPAVSQENGGYVWFENGQPYTGFRYYAGTFYWFVNGVRQNEGWRQAWGLTYYTDQDGRAVQGTHVIDGKAYNFGDDNTFYSRPVQGYVWDGSPENGGYRWYENGQLYTGFRYYAGTYYWFVDGVRQNAGWRQAWGLTYYTDNDGRAVQGNQVIDGKAYNFGDDNTFYSRPVQGYVWDGSPENGGYRWYENGQLYTGFRYYAGTYYWFVDGVRQNAGWRQAWGLTYYTDQDGRAVEGTRNIDGKNYYFGDDGTYFLRGETNYRQTVSPNVNVYGGPGLCLQYVDDAFGINSNRSYSAKVSADKAGWNGTMHYDNQFPVGVKVPVYWNLISKDDGVNYGHIAIWDGKGGFYWEGNNSSTPNYFTLDEMNQVMNGTRPVNGHYLTENWQTPSLIGWSTSLEGHSIAEHL